MNQTERILDLLALFISRARPVSLGELKTMFPEDYGRSSKDSARRTFERDKAVLSSLGAPLEYVRPDAEETAGHGEDGYRLKNESAIPVASLSASARRALMNAAFAALERDVCVSRAAARSALVKLAASLAGDGDGARDVSAGADVWPDARAEKRLGRVLEAVAGNRTLRLRIHSHDGKNGPEKRLLLPDEVCLRQGDFLLQGRLLPSGERTSVRLSGRGSEGVSVEGSAAPKGPQADEGTQAAESESGNGARDGLWVSLKVRREHWPDVFSAAALFPEASAFSLNGDGVLKMWVPAEALEEWASSAAQLFPLVRVTGPEEAVSEVRGAALACLRAHGFGAREAEMKPQPRQKHPTTAARGRMTADFGRRRQKRKQRAV